MPSSYTGRANQRNALYLGICSCDSTCGWALIRLSWGPEGVLLRSVLITVFYELNAENTATLFLNVVY